MHPPEALAWVPVAPLAQHSQDPVLHTEASLWPPLLPALRVLRGGCQSGGCRGTGWPRAGSVGLVRPASLSALHRTLTPEGDSQLTWKKATSRSRQRACTKTPWRDGSP